MYVLSRSFVIFLYINAGTETSVDSIYYYKLSFSLMYCTN